MTNVRGFVNFAVSPNDNERDTVLVVADDIETAYLLAELTVKAPINKGAYDNDNN